MDLPSIGAFLSLSIILFMFVGFWMAVIGHGYENKKIEMIGCLIAFFIMPILAFIIGIISLIFWGMFLFFGIKVA